jgi:2-polyprenyl-3-methyl-5-hydroxy-6-metoxy-1,4-benzoquinol methylase
MSETGDTPQFVQKMTDVLNYGALHLAMGIGYQAGLFDTMDEIGRYAAAKKIANQAGLNERYVTEWLSVMVCGGIVEMKTGEDGEDRFLLPRTHGDFLTRRSGNANLGVYTQEIPLLTECAKKAVVEGFRSGRGVSYEHYPEFRVFMAELAEAKHRKVLISEFLPFVDQGRVVERLRSGIEVCDLGCAEGIVSHLMAQAFPESRFAGLDIAENLIEAAGREAGRIGLRNVGFFCVDAVNIRNHPEFHERFDYVTAFDSIHDQIDPMGALESVAFMLKPDGVFSMVDIAADSRLAQNRHHPMGAFLYTVSLMHCMPVGLVDGGAGLGMMWGRQKAVEMLHKAGFRSVVVEEIPNDSFNFHYLCRKN